MLNYILLTFGFFACFFMVGFVFTEFFIPKLRFRLKVPLYFLLSVLISTYYIYLISLIFDFSRTTVTVSLFILVPLFISKFIKRKKEIVNYIKSNLRILILCTTVFTIYFVVLMPAILSLHNGHYVMSGSNWQDTPLHLSITQTLIQGNFPPQAPYFSGHALSYYYFTDFHSAIISILSTDFFPKIFVFCNSLLALVLCLSIYTLSFEITKNKKIAVQSALLGTFFSSYLSVKFIEQLLAGGKASEILVHKSFSMEYDQVFGMANMADYYLQNRPMMVGLPAFIVFVVLVLKSINTKGYKTTLLAGIIAGALIKFQLFTVLACCLTFFIVTIFQIRKQKLVFLIKRSLLFFIPIAILYFIFGSESKGQQSFLKLFLENVSLTPWDNQKPIIWHLQFLFLNLGLPFLISILAILSFKTSKQKFILLLSLVFISIPYLIRFTPAGGDMLKFFYFVVPFIATISITFIHDVAQNKLLRNFLITLLILSSTFSSFLTLANSYLNKNSGYSKAAYNTGLWIRENTPPNSIFASYMSIHNPASDIAGRLRVISYTNWPYSHGFNYAFDNVFSRSEDMHNLYNNADNIENVDRIMNKYKIDYIYLGPEETSNFLEAENKIESNSLLEKIYAQEDIKIYRRVK